MIIEHDMKEEPPYEINGNVIPFVGIILSADEILIIT